MKRENLSRDNAADEEVFEEMSELDIALLGDAHPRFRCVKSVCGGRLY